MRNAKPLTAKKVDDRVTHRRAYMMQFGDTLSPLRAQDAEEELEEEEDEFLSESDDEDLGDEKSEDV